MDRKMPSIMWTRGRRIVENGDVQIDDVDADLGVINAIVYGTWPYVVTVGVDASEDGCDCPFFGAHGFCKHVAAVVIYAQEHANSVEDFIADPSGEARPHTLFPSAATKTSEGARLVAQLGIQAPAYFHGLPEAPAPKLALEITLVVVRFVDETYQIGNRFALKFRIGERGSNKRYIIRKLGDFLNAYGHNGEFLATNKARFKLSPAVFTPEERELLATIAGMELPASYQLRGMSDYKRYVVLPLGSFQHLQPLLAKLPIVFAPDGNTPVGPAPKLEALTPEAAVYTATVTETNGDYALAVGIYADGVVPDEHVVIRGDTCYTISTAQQDVLTTFIASIQARAGVDQEAEVLRFKAAEKDSLVALLAYFHQIGTVQAPADLVPAPMTPHFDLHRAGNAAELTLSFDYNGTLIQDGATDTPVARNMPQEQQAHAYLKGLGFKPRGSVWRRDFDDAEALYHFFTAELPNMRANGVVTLDSALAARLQAGAALAPKVKVSESGGLLAVNFTFNGIGDSEVDAILAQLETNKPYVTRADGSIVQVDESLTQMSHALKQLRQQGRPSGGVVQVPAAQALVVQAALGDTAEFDAQFATLARDLAHPEAFPMTPRPVHATLRPYQLAGVQWLEMLNAHGFGGILADEMGLGKTLQLLTFLHDHLAANQVSLVVVPASLLYNWLAECHKFTPDINVAVVDGTKAVRREMIADDQHELLITSYNSILRDADDYAARDLQYLVLDEAQYVKNAGSKTHQCLRRLKRHNTFALSGTPVENRAEELWALFALVMPGLLPAKKAFNQLSPETIALQVKPFILRREKATVLKDLPEKVESTLTNEMTTAQKTVYLAQLKQMQVKVAGLSASGFVKNRLEILAGLTRLRQICDTPALYMPEFTGESGKLEQLSELIQQAAANGRHVLIFSQFTTMLAQIKARLDAAKLPAFVLQGATKAKERLAMVDAFNAGKRQFFLISLKAGGTGLNLTGADMVILCDLWWNPAVEDQAIARAHRIGQKHQVDVYRLVTQGTIEEQILKLQAQKRDFVDQVLSGTGNKGSLTPEDIKQILGLDSE
ncbi:DEAD/DEAH box helicase [Lacticaseibacillus sp. GG6-2]